MVRLQLKFNQVQMCIYMNCKLVSSFEQIKKWFENKFHFTNRAQKNTRNQMEGDVSFSFAAENYGMMKKKRNAHPKKCKLYLI